MTVLVTVSRIALAFALGFAAVVVGCTREAEGPAPAAGEQPAQVSPLRQGLGSVKGQFRPGGEAGKFAYSDKLRLEELVSAQNRDTVVAELVDCLDDQTPSQSTLDDRPVALGIVCYEALTQTVYHEPTAPNGDVASNWAGALAPSASPDEMRNAKAAWKKVLEEKSFSFL